MIGTFSKIEFCAESEATSSPCQISRDRTSVLGGRQLPCSLRWHSIVKTPAIKKGPYGGKFSTGHMAGCHDLSGPFQFWNFAILKWRLWTPDCYVSKEWEVRKRKQWVQSRVLKIVTTEGKRALLYGVIGLQENLMLGRTEQIAEISRNEWKRQTWRLGEVLLQYL